MANLNKVLLIGNLTRDPELRYTPSGVAVSDVRLAVNRHYTNSSGEPTKDTCFLDVVLWRRNAEVTAQYCKKGSPILIEGYLQMDEWEAQDGQKRSRIRVVAEKMQLMPRGQGRQQEQQDQAAPEQVSSAFRGDSEPLPEDDVPF